MPAHTVHISYYLVFALPESESSSTDANHEPFAVVRLDPLSGLPVHRRQQHRKSHTTGNMYICITMHDLVALHGAQT